MGGCLLLFLLLQLWRPCYFLTDDNLSFGFPILTEMGRAMKAGHSPFTSEYLFGGHYNYVRDPSTLQLHPFLLLPALLADTPARFWIMDVGALLFLLLATVGFALLARALREEFEVAIPDVYLIFYTLSFVFSTYVLTVGPSWLNFLGNQSALPWLALGIIDRRMVRGTILVVVFSLHEFLVAYPPLTFSAGFCLTLFAVGVAWWRRSARPLLPWCAGNVIALLIFLPLLLKILDGFAHSARNSDHPVWELSMFSLYVRDFPFSFLMGNWAEPFARLLGDQTLRTLLFPYRTSILACAAAWCFLPALFVPAKWRPLDKACVAIIGFVVLLMVRPHWLGVAMYHLPFFHSMRWPFREGMLLLFFAHVFLVLRFPAGIPRLQPVITLFSLLMFILPLPFIRPPTFNALAFDRQLLFSGQAEKFWAGMRSQLKPNDQIFTVIGWDFYNRHAIEIPFTLLGTYNFPAFLRVHCISGYSPTAPTDQLPLKIQPDFWFGAYRDEDAAQVFKERPDLKLLRIVSTDPLKITLTTSDGSVIDLTPYLNAAGIKSAPGS
jgi:hypothetical protein